MRYNRISMRGTIVLGLLTLISSLNGQIPEDVCPSQGGVIVRQPILAARAADSKTTFTCDFRVPNGELQFVSWVLPEQNDIIFSHIVDAGDIITDGFENLVLGYNTQVSEGSGHSEITLRAEINDTRSYKCDVYLKNFANCHDMKKIDFEAPELFIRASDMEICTSGNGCNFEATLYDKCHVISGYLDYCRPDLVLTLEHALRSEPFKNISTDVRISMNERGFCQANTTSLECLELTQEHKILFTVKENGRNYSLLFQDPETAGACERDCRSSSVGIYIGIIVAVLVIVLIILLVIWRCQKATNIVKKTTKGSSANKGYSPGREIETGNGAAVKQKNDPNMIL